MLALAKQLFLLAVTTALLLTTTCRAEIVSNRQTKLAGGTFRYFYDDTFTSSPCDSVVISIVGTAMTIGAYEELATSIVTGRGTVAIIMDNNPHNIQKQKGMKAARVANAIVADLAKHVPICSTPPSSGFMFGGHSAGGGGAVIAIQQNLLDFPLAGFIGMSPYGFPFKQKKKTNAPLLDVPVLLWDFSLMSCGVCPTSAAEAAYKLAEGTSTRLPARVFYQVQTNNTIDVVLGGDHCSYTDKGCFRMCGGGKGAKKRIHAGIGKTIDVFFAATRNGNFARSRFDIVGGDVVLYTGQEEVVKPPAKREAWFVRWLVKVICVLTP